MKSTEHQILIAKMNELQATVDALVNFHLEHTEKTLATPSDEDTFSQRKKIFAAEKKRILKGIV